MKIILENIKKEIINTSATNNNDIYKSNLYWSQKPYNICDILIKNFSDDGEVIFDPFMGSGVTIIQSLQKDINRKVIGVDINEVPIFITKTLLKKYDYNILHTEILRVIQRIEELNIFYRTNCNNCGGFGVVQKILFDRESIESEIKLKKVYYKCNCSKKTLEKEPDLEDIKNININYMIRNIDDIELLYNSRLAVYKGEKISDIFTKRNFVVLDKIVEIINDENDVLADNLKYILLSILHLSKITDTHSNSQWPLWTPKTNCIEKNIIELFKKRSKLFLKAIEYANKNLNENRESVNSYSELKNNSYLIIKKGIQDISDEDVMDNGVDLVITDPPYLGQVLYSEYMQLYKPFLNFSFNLEDEIVVSTAPYRTKKEDEYYKLMKSAFEKIGKKLKNGRYMCMYFHDSNLKVWSRLINLLSSSGFRYVSQVHIKKKNTLKNIISPKKSLNGDCIVFFIKEELIHEANTSVESIDEIEFNINKHIKGIIKLNGPLTTPELCDNGMLEFIIHNGWLHKLSEKYNSLVDIFEKELKWDKEIGKWYL